MTDFITATPNPAKPGQQLTICFEFDASTGVTGTSLLLDWGPDDVADQVVEVDSESPCVTVTVPAGATSLVIVDQSGSSSDHAVLIV